MDNEISEDFWEWLEDYHANNTIPLQFILAPDSPHIVTVGSPVSCLKLTKRECQKLGLIS